MHALGGCEAVLQPRDSGLRSGCSPPPEPRPPLPPEAPTCPRPRRPGLTHEEDEDEAGERQGGAAADHVDDKAEEGVEKQ